MRWTGRVARLAVVTGALWVQGAVGAGNAVYVSPDGDDANPGTAERPLATLEAARDAARSLTDNGRTVPDGGVRVVLKAGRYHRTSTFELDERDSGAEGRPVIYTAQTRGKVILDGGVIIPPSAVTPVTDPAILNRIIEEDARPHLVQIDLHAHGITDITRYGPRGFRRSYRNAAPELFINGESQTVARWPNVGDPHIQLGKVVKPGSAPRSGEFDLRPAEVEFGTERARLWGHARDLFLSGIFCYVWADDTIGIAQIDLERGVFVTDEPHFYGMQNRDYTKWFAINLLEEIDQPGEYYIDREFGILYLYPPHDLDDALIQVSRMDEAMIAIEGASHLHMERLTIETGRSTGIYIERGEANRIAGCTIRNMGELGIQVGMGTEDLPHGLHNGHGVLAAGVEDPALASRRMGNWHEHIYKYPTVYLHGGHRHRIESCDIHDTGAGGILLTGGNRKTLVPGGHEVVNCNIHRVNRLDRTYKACINVDGVGHRIAHNRLHSTESQAVYLHGNDHVIEYNEIHNVVLASADMGAIYMGRDATETGHIIRHNFFHHIFDFAGGVGVQAIFFDDGMLYAAQIFGNVFYRTGSSGVIKHHQSLGTSIANNIAINSPQLLQQAGTGAINYLRDPSRIQYARATVADPDDFRGVDVRIEPYKSAYPLLHQTFNTGENFSPQRWNNFATQDLSMFVDPDALDFTLKPDAPPLSLVAVNVTDRVAGIVGQDMPFQDIPFGMIGIYEDDYRRTPRDPTPNAGSPYRSVDHDGNGWGRVFLDGSASVDPDGRAASYEWLAAGVVIAAGITALVELPVGTHAVTLRITDVDGTPHESLAGVVVAPHVDFPFVTASSYQDETDNIHPPENTLDGNLDTRWAARGIQWITFDLGVTMQVDRVGIAFFRGDERDADFSIEVSQDGTLWTGVRPRQQSGERSLDVQDFDFPAVPARFVRINGWGNTSDDWNSFTVVEINRQHSNFDGNDNGIPDAWEETRFGRLLTEQDEVDGQVFEAWFWGRDPLATGPHAELRLSTDENSDLHIDFLANAAEGIGYTGLERRFTLQSSDTLAPAAWKYVEGFSDIGGDNLEKVHPVDKSGPQRIFRLRCRLINR